ncbi:LOW QUALITY PROTEIN: hypothetical protein PanWU01x14_017260 [Parasponia andersonii]|uniref:Uncharacterized protein n=1 Tax=Parasponia andersonii TaxID=3476 RepID=A0A2P5DZW9_PARAD|nr:LOW QUALITY PROTEIN: hypothetical protein PanWU01x14_017260 [Parasponia andersonii]
MMVNCQNLARGTKEVAQHIKKLRTSSPTFDVPISFKETYQEKTEMWRDDDCDDYYDEEEAHELLEDEQSDVTIDLSSSIVIISKTLPTVLLPSTPSSLCVAAYELELKIMFSYQANYSNKSRVGIAG